MQMELLLDPAYSSPPSIFSSGPVSTAAADSHCGKTSLAPTAAARAETLQAWLNSWQDSTTLQCPSTAGARKAARWATMDCSNGHVWTRNGSEWRSGAAACSLSSILETGPVAPQYFLSAKACAGILRRAEKRGKTLPELLHRALAAVADSLTAAALPDCSSPLYCLAHGQGGAELGIDRSATLTCNHEAPIVAGDLTAIAFDSRQDCISSTEVFGSLGSSSPQAQAITYAIQAGALRANPNSGPDGVGVQAHIAYTLEARAEVQAIAFSCKDHGADATIELAPTMRAMGHAASHANAGGQLAVCITGDVTHCLKAEGFDASEDGTGRGQPIVASVSLRGREGGATAEMGGDLAGTLRASGGGGDKAHALIGMAVRRLTPTETERLQGFPDGYTSIPIKKYARKRVTKLRPESMWAQIDGNWWLLAADGPRYKSHGNSFAVPVVAWIGHRIDAAMRANFAHEREIARVE